MPRKIIDSSQFTKLLYTMFIIPAFRTMSDFAEAVLQKINKDSKATAVDKHHNLR